MATKNLNFQNKEMTILRHKTVLTRSLSLEQPNILVSVMYDFNTQSGTLYSLLVLQPIEPDVIL